MKHFMFKWQEEVKFGKPSVRQNMVHAKDAKDATEAFIREFGNLKKNTIFSIQEVDKAGVPIGEPIVPEDEKVIVAE